MIDLLKSFTVEQVIIFIIMLALGIKGLIDFCDWVKNKNSNRFKKDYIERKQNEDLRERTKRLEENFDKYHHYAESLDNKIADLTDTMNDNFKVINVAIMHDIKQWIINQHKYYIELGWINISQLDMIEARYEDYVALGGNSTVPGLMEELRALPKHEY